jgi:hypothetical protein
MFMDLGIYCYAFLLDEFCESLVSVLYLQHFSCKLILDIVYGSVDIAICIKCV